MASVAQGARESEYPRTIGELTVSGGSSGSDRAAGEGPTLTAPQDSGPVSVPLLRYVNLLLRHLDLVFVVPVITVGAVCAITLLQARWYTSTASFTPQTRSTPASLSNFAAQFGFVLPTVDANRSPPFYVDLIQSHQILGRVVDGPYLVRSGNGTIEGSLADMFRTKAGSNTLRREAAIRRLRALLSVNLVQRTGVVNVAVRARYPELAVQIVSKLLEELNRFNLEARQSQAAAERRFTEQRLEEVRQDLRGAEDRLQGFLQRNRDLRTSPHLSFEQDRLARDVTMRQQLYTTLSQAYEQARIEEVRDTPLITVIEQPEVPVKPDTRGLVRKGLVAAFLGGLFGVALAIGKELFRQTASEGSKEVREFAKLKSEILAGPLQAFGRFRSRP